MPGPSPVAPSTSKQLLLLQQQQLGGQEEEGGVDERESPAVSLLQNLYPNLCHVCKAVALRGPPAAAQEGEGERQGKFEEGAEAGKAKAGAGASVSVEDVVARKELGVLIHAPDSWKPKEVRVDEL